MKRKIIASTALAAAVAVAVLVGLTRPRSPGVRTAALELGVREVAEFIQRPVFDEQVFLSGYLVEGTLCRVAEPCELRFLMTDRAANERALPFGHTLAVRFASCLAPRPLRSRTGEDIQVIVGGQVCATCHDFQASDVLARAASAAEAPRALPDSLDDIPLCSAP